ncbi:partial glycerol-3-phosphate cytidylyltransferase, partial [uncultured bacterium]
MKTLYTIEEMKAIRTTLRESGKKVVFTNGCFDILHPGHLDYL